MNTSMNTPGGSIILCSDDFALTKGISEGILALAEAKRLSATSAIVTTGHWRTQAKFVMHLRDHLAVGLHLNFTFGPPLGPMPGIAPNGVLPSVGRLAYRSLSGCIDCAEIAAEVERQLDQFEAEAGFPPDFVDGHHHVHILPGLRDAVIGVLSQRFPFNDVLVRDPSDNATRIFRRRVAAKKALGVAILAVGFRGMAITRGFPVNIGFSGYSTFGAIPYERELDAFLLYPGLRHMIMCHPGFFDSEWGSYDPIACRRPIEYAVLSKRFDLPRLLWQPKRKNGARTELVDWRE